MQKDWGYAALVEYGGKPILFDTGNNPEILAQNAKAKDIDLSKLDFAVMSHRHGDHMGGLARPPESASRTVSATAGHHSLRTLGSPNLVQHSNFSQPKRQHRASC